MRAFTKPIICPFCFHSFPVTRLLFRCMIPGCQGQESDSIYAQARGYTSAIMGRILAPDQQLIALRVPQQAACDLCHNVSHTRICPHCHFELPHDVGLIDQRIVAIIGGRATGKTHYIASLINHLQHDTGKNFNLTVRMLGDNTQQRWEQDFYTPLFVNKTVLQPNLPAEVDAQVKTPLIFRLTFTHGRTRRVLNMSFFDTAGEDMTTLTNLSIQNRYIGHADGLIFLLDPLQIPQVRQQIRNIPLPPVDPRASPENIVGRLRDLFEREHHLRAEQKATTPVAFTLSKIDTLFPLLDPGSLLHTPSEHTGYLDLNDVQSVHTEIAGYLTAWINANFCRAIENNFARYNYFGISSLGEQPDPSNRLATINPLRVEDPFLWILYQLKLIPGKKRQ